MSSARKTDIETLERAWRRTDSMTGPDAARIKMSSFSRLPITWQLLLLVILTAVPLMAATLLAVNRMSANELQTVRQALMSSSVNLAALVDNEIDTHAAIASTLAQSAHLQNGELESFWFEAQKALLFVPGSWLALSTPDGLQVLNTLAPYGTALPKHAQPDVIARGFATMQPQVADLVLGPVAQKQITYVEMPSFKNGQPLYSLSVGMAPSRFVALLARLFTRGEVVGILDRNKRFVARTPDHETRVGTLASDGWRAAIDAVPDGMIRNLSLEGDWVVTGYARTQTGWTVGVAQPEAAIIGPQRSVLVSTVTIAGVLIAISLGCAIAIATHISRGTNALKASAQKLSDGESIAPIRTPFAEAAAISATLVEVGTELKRRGEVIAQDRAALETRVTERTRDLELEIIRRSETESQLRQAQKMEAVGQLTGGIAHDFNNMLAIVLGNLNMAQRKIGRGDTDVLRYVDNAIDGAQRGASLTHRLLAFSRQQPLMPVVTDANALVSGMAELIRRTIGDNIQLEIVQAGGLWRTIIDGGQLEQAIVNLAVNARDAMEAGGRLTIETFNASLDDAYAQQHPGVPSGQYAGIAVSDNGAGMSADVASKAFDPFFTTKDVGKGTGLGLSQVFGFVRQSGGHVKIYSELGHGTAVKLYLPRYRGEEQPVASTPAAPALEPPTARPSETIVVVEDEDQVRRMVVDSLRDLGYLVAHASRGAQGLDVLDKVEGVSLLVTDIVMPDMNGRELADIVQKTRPDLKVLYMTGYTRNAVIHDGKLDANVNFLAKPFTIAQLATKVRAVIDGE